MRAAPQGLKEGTTQDVSARLRVPPFKTLQTFQRVVFFSEGLLRYICKIKHSLLD